MNGESPNIGLPLSSLSFTLPLIAFLSLSLCLSPDPDLAVIFPVLHFISSFSDIISFDKEGRGERLPRLKRVRRLQSSPSMFNKGAVFMSDTRNVA